MKMDVRQTSGMGDMIQGTENSSMSGKKDAYSKILCNTSIHALSRALPPSDANSLLILLGVPDKIRIQNQMNHNGDVVAGTNASLRYWITQGESGKQPNKTNLQHLFNDLLDELGGLGRQDLKAVIERAFEMNKKLDKNDFVHL